MDSDSEKVVHLFALDPERTAMLERAGFKTVVHQDAAILVRMLETRAGVALLGQWPAAQAEAIRSARHPVLLLREHSLENAHDLGEVTILDQNVSETALLSVVRSAFRESRLRIAVEKAQAEAESKAQLAEEEFQQFVYSASHDLKEPLRMVSGYLQLLEKRYGTSLNEEAREFIGLAVDGATRMSKLLSDLLIYSRVGTRPNRLELVNGNDVILWLRMNRQQMLDEHGVELTADTLPPIYFEQGEMLQLLEQLIENAVKFRTNTEKPKVHVSAESRNGEWIFAVRDNGIGFDPQHADRIF